MPKMSWEEAIKGAKTIDDVYSMEEEQQRVLYKLACELPEKSVMLELGVCRGKTAAVLCYVAKHRDLTYYGIDDFSLGGSLPQVQKCLDDLDLPHNIVEGKTQDVPWEASIDLLIIDAGHYEEPVKSDCEKYIPFVKPGGYVAFHDYEKEFNQKSAHWAIHFYAEKITGKWKTYVLSNNLLIRQKPLT